MKKVLLLATILAFTGTSYAYCGGGKDKKCKSQKECVKGSEKKGCCSSKPACCKKPATGQDVKASK